MRGSFVALSNWEWEVKDFDNLGKKIWFSNLLACSHWQNIISSRKLIKQNRTQEIGKKKFREKGSQTLILDWVMQQNNI